jgi:hypothetical protein
MLGLFFLLSIIINLCRKKTGKPVILKLLSSVYIAGITTIFSGLCVVIILLKISVFFGKNFCQLGFIVGFLTVAVLTIICYIKMCKLGKKKEPNAFGMSATQFEINRKFTNFKNSMLRYWLFTLLFAAPFLLLLISNSDNHLISVVLDNSGSTSNYMEYEKAIFSSILEETRTGGDYVLSYFPYEERAYFNSFDTLTKQKTQSKLHTITEHYSDQRQFLNAFYQVMSSGSSPIYEAIWQNYLMCKEIGGNHSSKKLILITDGADNLYWNQNSQKVTDRLYKNIFEIKDKDGKTISEYFNEIVCISWTDESEGVYMFADCENSIQILDGTNQMSYYKSLMQILPEMFFDVLLLYILTGIAVLLFLIILFTKQTLL